MRMTFHCILAFIYNMLLLNNNLYINGEKAEFGALMMGVHHGAFCLGCCWALMALLFVGGVMNLYWIIGIAIYVAIEKLLPRLGWLDKGLGVSLIGAGILLAV